MSGWTWRPAQRDVASRAEGTWRPAQRGRGVPCRGHVRSLAEGMWRPAQRGRGVQRERGVPRRRVQGGRVTRPRHDLWAWSLWACGCVGARAARARARVKLPYGEFAANKSRANTHTCVEPCTQRRSSKPQRQHGASNPTSASSPAFSTGPQATSGPFRQAKGRFGLNTAGFRVGQHRAGSGQPRPISNTPKPGFGRGKLGPDRPAEQPVRAGRPVPARSEGSVGPRAE